MLMLQEFEVPDTRYVISLRDPTERVISQLFEWHGTREAFFRWKREEITPQVIHDIVAIQVERVKECFIKHSPKGCIFMTPSVDGPNNFGMYSSR